MPGVGETMNFINILEYMEINEVNKKLYESAFISDGTFGDLNNWKPDIDESLVEESIADENGNWIPATPLGYRDYKLSRKEGLNTIFHKSVPSRVFTLEDAYNIKREDNIIKKYDLITIDKSNYIVVGDDVTMFYVVNEDDHEFYIEYQS